MRSPGGTIVYCHSHELMLESLKSQVVNIHENLQSVESEVKTLVDVQSESSSESCESDGIYFNPLYEDPVGPKSVPANLKSANVTGTLIPKDCTCVPNLPSTVTTLERQINSYISRLSNVNEKLNTKVQLYSVYEVVPVVLLPVIPVVGKFCENKPDENMSSKQQPHAASNLPHTATNLPQSSNCHNCTLAGPSRNHTKMPTDVNTPSTYPVVPFCYCCDDCVRCMRWFCDSMSVKLSHFKNTFQGIKLQITHLQQEREREALARLELVQESSRCLSSKFACLDNLGSNCTEICTGLTDFESVGVNNEVIDETVQDDDALFEKVSNSEPVRKQTTLEVSFSSQSEVTFAEIQQNIDRLCKAESSSELNVSEVSSSPKTPLLSRSQGNDTTMPVTCSSIFSGVKNGSVLHKAKRLFSRWRSSKSGGKYVNLENPQSSRSKTSVEIKYVKWFELDSETGSMTEENGCHSGTVVDLNPTSKQVVSSASSDTDNSSVTTVHTSINVEQKQPTNSSVETPKIVESHHEKAQNSNINSDESQRVTETANKERLLPVGACVVNKAKNVQHKETGVPQENKSPSKRSRIAHDTELTNEIEQNPLKKKHRIGTQSATTSKLKSKGRQFILPQSETRGRQLVIPTLRDTAEVYQPTSVDETFDPEDANIQFVNIIDELSDHDYCDKPVRVSTDVYTFTEESSSNPQIDRPQKRKYPLYTHQNKSPESTHTTQGSPHKLSAKFVKSGNEYVYRLGKHLWTCKMKLSKFWNMRPYVLFGHITEEMLEELLDQPDYCKHYYDSVTNEISRTLLDEIYRIHRKSPRFFARELVWKLFTLRELYKKKIASSNRNLRTHQCLDENRVYAIKYSVLNYFPIEEIYWSNRCVPFINHSISDLFSRKLQLPVFKSFIERNKVKEYVV